MLRWKQAKARSSGVMALTASSALAAGSPFGTVLLDFQNDFVMDGAYEPALGAADSEFVEPVENQPQRLHHAIGAGALDWHIRC